MDSTCTTRLEAAIDAGIQWKERAEFWKTKTASYVVINSLKDEQIDKQRAKRKWLIAGGIITGVGSAVSMRTTWGLIGLGAGGLMITLNL